jgi:hypothetical protein
MPELAKSMRINPDPQIAIGGNYYPEEENRGAWWGEEPVRQLQMPREYFDKFNKVWATAATHSQFFTELTTGSLRRQNAVTQTDTVEIESNKAKEIIMSFKTQLTVSFRSVLTDGLLELFNFAKEENPDSVGISTGSLRSFFNFLQIHPDLKCPDIALTPESNIYVSWRSGRNKVFSLEFASNNVVHFVVFAQNKLDPEMIDRVSGNVLASTIMKSVEPYNVVSWVYDERG